MPDTTRGGRFPDYDVLSKRPGVVLERQDARGDRATALHWTSAEVFYRGRIFDGACFSRSHCAQPRTGSASRSPHSSIINCTSRSLTAIGAAGTPRDGEAWRLGLRALDVEADAAFGARFHNLAEAEQNLLLERMQKGELRHSAWSPLTSDTFFKKRMARDIVLAYYAHPTAWSEIGWGGPASPRGYVRMDYDERDPWEAAEVRGGDIETARRKNHRVDDPFAAPRAADGRAPDVFRPGGWVPMREYRQDEIVDFAIVGTGAGGGTLACNLAEHGFSVVALDAGPYFRPLEDFASDESEQAKLYWTDDRIVDGDNPLQMGSNNSGKTVGGSTVHFAMVSLRFRPEWFKSRSLLGYGADWPLDWREMWNYYSDVEDALKIAGPVNYPWGPPPSALPLPGA